MKITSSEASKMLKNLNEDRKSLLNKEREVSSFVASPTENLDSVRPEYNYEETQKALYDIEKKIITLKHALNIFNSTFVIKEFNMTIDEILVYLPLLNSQKDKLNSYRTMLPKKRQDSYSSSQIEYLYTNFDIKQAEKEYQEISAKLSRVQTVLDYVNSTEQFELDI